MCSQAHSHGSARPALTPAPRVWPKPSNTSSCSRRRRRGLGRRSRVSRRRRFAAAAALHGEEAGEAEDKEVERADHGGSEVK